MAEEFIVYNKWDIEQLIIMLKKLDLSRPLKFKWSLFSKKRSLSANALQHIWYRTIAKEMTKRGNVTTEERVKEVLKHTFLGYETTERVNILTGEVTEVQTLRNTSDLDSGESYFYMLQIEEFAISRGIILKNPCEGEYRKWQLSQVV